MADYDFWLFDLDGTLVDVEPAYPVEVMERVGDRLGQGFSEREAALLWYGQGDARRGLLAEREVDPSLFWDVFHEEEDPLERAEATYLYDDVEGFLADRTDPVGLVTHCQAYLTEPILDGLDISDWFDTVVCCDDDIGWKPDPEPVHRAMSDMGAHTGHAGVLAGDNPGDIGAAWNAGLDGIHVARDSPISDDRCVRGDHRVTSLLEL
ncbi:HAD family hydrolase [Haloarcula onubensis]|uniref:HAD family hydrolase n=1 Tax=Haloarcula onubensis TaxID=2950539 RepID=A0ABU2FS39_9EURY|nr:HAD family hydrolase [Halomicroarcula sp. S3CR25-11]MDS0283587.1 HAD family hydrolase [Halomicroarcula sp. S3CR25-11]